MSLARYWINIDDRVPARWMAVLERGAIVNGTQAIVNTVTVHSPHEFATNDKFLYAETRGNIQNIRVFTVTSATATTVTFGGAAFSFPDKALLLNAGADTGGVQQDDGSYTKLEYDAAAVAVYKDPQGSAAWTGSRVLTDPGGECGFWGSGQIVWAVALNNGGLGIRIYPDLGSTGGGASRGTVLPVTATPGQFFLKDNGPGVGDTLCCYMKQSNNNYDWTGVIDAS